MCVCVCVCVCALCVCVCVCVCALCVCVSIHVCYQEYIVLNTLGAIYVCGKVFEECSLVWLDCILN